MPSCTVCDHHDRPSIDAILATGTLSQRKIASRYGLVVQSLRRHLANHVSQRVVKAAEAHEIKQGDVFMDSILSTIHRGEKCASIGAGALEDESVSPEARARLGIGYQAQGLKALELLGNATGRLQAQSAGGVTTHINVLLPRGLEAPEAPTIECQVVPALPEPPLES